MVEQPFWIITDFVFPIYSEYWGGGIADIVYDPGKYVAGVVFDLPESDLKILDAKVGRQIDETGKEVGLYKRIEVRVAPLGKSPPVDAVTYTGVNVEKISYPPDTVLHGPAYPRVLRPRT
ncbi:MAG: hypothetical protein KatS3mg104_2737 [Phycisphaerae bacterium]|nr:MAG: hypothetical protein KatS3mg104_2737 [Phycisphaerae bacterium]